MTKIAKRRRLSASRLAEPRSEPRAAADLRRAVERAIAEEERIDQLVAAIENLVRSAVEPKKAQ